MSLSQKLRKLLKTNDDENIKLAKNIILAQTKESNVIAMLCALKEYRQFDILEDHSMIRAVNKVLETKIDFKGNITSEEVNYAPSELLRWALQIFKSQENIEAARDYYIYYISELANASLKILKPTQQPPKSPPVGDDLPF